MERSSINSKKKTEGLDDNAAFTTENMLNVLRPEVSTTLYEYDPVKYTKSDKTEAHFQLSSMKDFEIGQYEEIKSPTESGHEQNQKLFKHLHQDIVFMQNAKEQITDSMFLKQIFDDKESCTHLMNFLTHLTK